MVWKKISETRHEAVGTHGKFIIERSKGLWWSRWWNETSMFRMPPKRKLSEAKEMCEENIHWEDR